MAGPNKRTIGFGLVCVWGWLGLLKLKLSSGLGYPNLALALGYLSKDVPAWIFGLGVGIPIAMYISALHQYIWSIYYCV